MQASSYASQILALNGVVGASSSFCYLIITVSRLNWRGYGGMATSFSDCDVISVVMTKLKEKDGITKYHINRRVCFLALSPTRALAEPLLQAYSPGSVDLSKLHGPGHAARDRLASWIWRW